MGGLFSIFHKKSASKAPKRAILHTSQANGGGSSPPPGYATERIIESQFCKAIASQQFCKESRKLQTRIMPERYCSFFHYYLLSCRYVLFQKRILSK